MKSCTLRDAGMPLVLYEVLHLGTNAPSNEAVARKHQAGRWIEALCLFHAARR